MDSIVYSAYKMLHNIYPYVVIFVYIVSIACRTSYMGCIRTMAASGVLLLLILYRPVEYIILMFVSSDL